MEVYALEGQGVWIGKNRQLCYTVAVPDSWGIQAHTDPGGKWKKRMAGEKVLVIDDSDELRSLLASLLPYGGYDPYGAGSGQEGLDLVLQIHPDLILIDLELPDTTGLKVLEELSRRGFTIPTIMMTGYGSEGSAARALRLGVRDYLIKPFTTEEVLSSIERALSESRLRREKDHQNSLLAEYGRRLKLFAAIGQSMGEDVAASELLRRIVEAAVLATRAEVGFLLALDHEREALRVVSSRGLKDPMEGQVMAAGDERLLPVLQQGSVVRLCAEGDDTITIQTGARTRAVCQAPLQFRGRTLGVLGVDRRKQTAAFSSLDEQSLKILAAYAALEMDRVDPLPGQ